MGTPSIGVMLPRDLPAADVLPFARAADAHGFAELWVVEDCFFRGGIAQAAAVLATTPRIHVGIGILPAAVRNAAFTTLEIATLAELFPGRITVGIGHGMPAWMRQIGAWPASPLTLLEETLLATRALLRGERLSVHGRHVQLDAVILERPPAVVPLIIAGVRSPKSLAVSGRCADGTILAEPVTPEYLSVARAQIGARNAHHIVAYTFAAIDADVRAARASVRPALLWIGEPDSLPHIAPLPFAAELAALRTRCANPQEFAAALPDSWVDQLAVIGPPAAARARIAQLHTAGANSVVLIPVGPDPIAALNSLARLLPAA